MTSTQTEVRTIALIPARSGSKRIPAKNVRTLAGHPALAYTIAAALESAIFDAVLVSTDSEEYARISRHYGAEVPFLRPAALAGDLSPDIEWVDYTLRRLVEAGRSYDCFSILRPTNPFRLPGTIRRAWDSFRAAQSLDSLRAVERCRQHPGKMWIVRGQRMLPLLPFESNGLPWHSSQYQALPQIYVQNASLEIAWTRVVFEDQSIAGQAVMPFFTEDLEGFDLNHPDDWRRAEEIVAVSPNSLPTIRSPQFQS